MWPVLRDYKTNYLPNQTPLRQWTGYYGNNGQLILFWWVQYLLFNYCIKVSSDIPTLFNKSVPIFYNQIIVNIYLAMTLRCLHYINIFELEQYLSTSHCSVG